jgi:hypothetical protein
MRRSGDFSHLGNNSPFLFKTQCHLFTSKDRIKQQPCPLLQLPARQRRGAPVAVTSNKRIPVRVSPSAQDTGLAPDH